MAASYPTSVKTFTTKADGGTISASHVNDLQLEVTAIETGLKSGFAHDILFTDATYDIGKTGATRPRDFFLSRNATIGGTGTFGGAVTVNAGLTTVGTVYIGDTSNANITLGLTINQGAADDKLFAVKSSDVAHGMTDLAETDTYFDLKKIVATEGGASFGTYSEGSYSFAVQAYYTTDTATRSTAGIAPVMFFANLKSGTTSTNPAADKNIFAVASGGNTRFILDSDGDSFQDVGTAWTQFDSHDDAEVLEALAIHVGRKDDPVKRTFGEFIATNKQKLTELKLVTFNEDGHHFVNMSRLTMLLVGAARQSAARISRLERMALEPLAPLSLEA